MKPLASETTNDITGIAKDVLEQLLSLMGVVGSVALQTQPIIESAEEADTSIIFNIKGDDLGILIGRRGQTLSCLQYIVRIIVGHKTKAWVSVVIDVGGYKQRRYRALQILARQMAEQVETKGTSVTLEPMTAYERRLIHITLADHPDVNTESIGQGEARRVVIAPKEE